MMKFFFLFILSAFSISFRAQNPKDQAEIIVHYEMTLQDPSNTENKSTYNFVLIANREMSIFADTAAHNYYNNTKSPELRILHTTLPRSRTSVFKNGKKTTTYLPILYDMFSYEEPNLEWELIPGETKKFNNYTCYLAKTKSKEERIYYAWYYPEVSIPEGPYRFKGLPGLILEAYSEDKAVVFSALGMKKTDEKIEKINYLSVIHMKDKKEFIKRRNEMITNPSLINTNSTVNVKIDGEDISKRVLNQKINPKMLLD